VTLKGPDRSVVRPIADQPNGELTLVTVPPDQAGKVWSLDNIKTSFPFNFERIPNLMSPSKEQVIVPLGVN